MCQKEPLVTLDLSLSITFHLSFLSDIQDQLELLRHSQVFLRRLLKKQNENPEYLLLKNLTVSIWTSGQFYTSHFIIKCLVMNMRRPE